MRDAVHRGQPPDTERRTEKENESRWGGQVQKPAQYFCTHMLGATVQQEWWDEFFHLGEGFPCEHGNASEVWPVLATWFSNGKQLLVSSKVFCFQVTFLKMSAYTKIMQKYFLVYTY